MVHSPRMFSITRTNSPICGNRWCKNIQIFKKEMCPPPPPPPPPPQSSREYFRALRFSCSCWGPGGVTPLLKRTANAFDFWQKRKICVKGGTRHHEFWRMFVENVKCTKVDYWIQLYAWYENESMKTKQKRQKYKFKGGKGSQIPFLIQIGNLKA